MQDLNDKITGGVLTAAEWNEVPSEIQNVIEKTGIVLSGGDLDQLGKAIANYVGNGDFYTDSGAADVYVLSTVGSKQTPSAYVNGMRIRFVAGNSNTGASTINVASLGVKNLKRENGTDLNSGDIIANIFYEFRYDGVSFTAVNPLLYPAILGEAGINNYEFAYEEAFRFIASSLHAGIIAGTNVTDLTTYLQNALDSTLTGLHCPFAGPYEVTGLDLSIHALHFVGDGILTRFKGTGDHTLTVPAGNNDILIGSVWIDQIDGVGSFDAIHLLGTETRIRHVDIDDAPRYGIYIGGFRTMIHQVQMQAVLDTGIYILSTANLNSVTDVNFVIAGPKIPGKCIDVQSDNNTIASIIADQCIGYVLNLAGAYNTASNITARQPGGATANDFIRIVGNFNSVSGAVAKSATGIGALISGSSNIINGLIIDTPSGIGLHITGNDNEVNGRIFNAGANGVAVSGNGNEVKARVNASTGDDLGISGTDNSIKGRFQGAIVLTAAAVRTKIDAHCGSIVVPSGASNGDFDIITDSNVGTVVDIASTGNVLKIRATKGGTIGCGISGNDNTGIVSVFGGTDTCIEVDGNGNILQVNASGAAGEEVRIGGNNNVITGNVTGDVVIEGDGNVLTMNITGNITYNTGADNNRLTGFVGGVITDNGTGNDNTNVT